MSSVDHGSGGKYPACQGSQPGRGETADQVFREHRQPLLEFVVGSEAAGEQAEGLRLAVPVRHYMGSDLMLDEGFDPLQREAHLRSDQQIAGGHH